MRVGQFLRRRLERRRSPRIDGEDLVAYYWTGTIPSPREVRQIGLHGGFIVAPDRFYPGTLVQIVLEDRAASGADGSPPPHICVYAKALRKAADGFSVAFLFGDARERRRFGRFLGRVKRKALVKEEPEAAKDPAEGAFDPGGEDHYEAKGQHADDLT